MDICFKTTCGLRSNATFCQSITLAAACFLLILLCLHSESHIQDKHNRNIQNDNKDSANNNNKCDILQVGNKTISGI